MLIGIDIGGTKTAISRWNGRIPEELARFSTSTPDDLQARLASILQDSDEEPTFGIVCGGPLNSSTGTILTPPNLPAWHNVSINRLVTERFGGQAILMNDANANALAEWKFGAGRGKDSLIFLTAGTGMGAGLIIDGRLITGLNGNAGEVGHIRIAPDGPRGYGKAGSFEGYCSGGTLPQLVQWLPAKEQPPDLEAWCRDHPSARHVMTAAQAGDPTAQQVLRLFGKKLGQALAQLIDILNPQGIILGTIYVVAQTFIEPEMRKALHSEALPSSLASCEILAAQLGSQLGNYGAICAALHASYERPNQRDPSVFKPSS